MAVRRHDHDAGGDPGVLAAKAALREEVWRAMSVPGVARFPGPEGRIPNFVGAEAAAPRLRATPEWERATTLKANPDAPQRRSSCPVLDWGELTEEKIAAVPILRDLGERR